MSSSYTVLADLRAGRCSNTAEVRLLRFWEAKNINKGGQLMSVEMLLIDEHTEIIILLAKDSIDAVRNVLAAVPTLSQAAEIPVVYKYMNLHDLTVQSLRNLARYQNLIDRCLSAGNLEAHYIRGMQDYFQKENIAEGLAHLQLAAEGLYDNAIYLYGIIMLCTGSPEIGKPLLDSLGWRNDKARADACWESIKTSIHGVTVKRFAIYVHNYRGTRASITCHRNNFAIRCQTCYYMKQMKRFVYII